VPNDKHGKPGTLNVRTSPKGKIVAELPVSKKEDGYDVQTYLAVQQKKGDWWFVTSGGCGETGPSGWVKAKYLVEHPVHDDDGCGC
jgi:hypothetical protein